MMQDLHSHRSIALCPDLPHGRREFGREPAVYEAVLMGRMYFSDFNPKSLRVAIGRLREVVRRSPGEALPYATLAMLLANAGHEPRWKEPVPLEEIRQLAAEAWRIDPEDPWSIIARGYAAGITGNDGEIRRLAAMAETARHAPAITRCCLGVLLILQDIDLPCGMRLIESARLTNPYQPCAVHVVQALAALRWGDLDGTLTHLDAYGLRWGWAAPLLRGAVHAMKGEREAAALELRAVHEAYPDLGNASAEGGRLVWHPSHIRFLFDAFAHAGVTVQGDGQR